MVYKSKPIVGVKPFKSSIPKAADSEDALQRQIVTHLRAHGAFIILTDAVGPALKYMPSQIKRMGFISWSKARGWSKGVPDLLVAWKGEFLFLELKFGKKGKLSEEQKVWRDRLLSEGYQYACWTTLKECEDWITSKLEK